MEIEVIDGVEWRRERYSNGQLCYEHPFVDGRLHGLCRTWRSSGQLWCEYPYVNGKLHGLRRSWYDNGPLSFVGLWNKSRLVFKAYNPPQTSGKWKLK